MMYLRPWMALVLYPLIANTPLALGADDAGGADAAFTAKHPNSLDDAWSAAQLEPRMNEPADSATIPSTANHAPPPNATGASGRRTIVRRDAGTSSIKTSNEAAPNAATATTGTGWFRTSLALGGVVGLIVLLSWGYRAVTSTGGKLPFRFQGRRPGLIEVVGRTSLAPRQSVCLLRVGPRMVLLGVTSGQISALDVIDDPELTARLLGEDAAQKPESATRAFSTCLSKEQTPYLIQAAAPESAPAVGPTDVRQALDSALRRLRTSAKSA